MSIEESASASIRESLLRLGREMLASGAVAGTWGNLSAWDETRGGFWVTPSGMDYRVLTEDDLVLLDLDEKVLEGLRRPSSEAVLHAEVYKARLDVKGIVHTHSVYATAHAAARTSIPAIVEDLVQIVGGEVETTPYALPGSQELALTVAQGLRTRNAVLLANHGLVGVGSSLEEAWKVCQVVEKGAMIHAWSKMLGGPVLLSDEDVETMRQEYLQHYGQR